MNTPSVFNTNNNFASYTKEMKHTFEIASEPSIVGAIATAGIIAIASIVVLAPAKSRPASLAAVVAIFAVVHGSFDVVQRWQAK